MKSPLLLTINRSIIVDQVAQFLIATGQVPYRAEIVDIIFNELSKDTKTIKIAVIFKDEEVKLTYYGDATP